MLSGFRHDGDRDAAGDDGNRKSALHRLQSEFLILEQERQKKSRYRDTLVLELRRLGMEQDRLAVRMEDKRQEEAVLSRELGLLEAEAKRLKRKIGLFS